MSKVKKGKCCRLCGSSNLDIVLKLASTPPANEFVTESKIDFDQKKYPLELFFCNNCSHVQLLEVVNPSELFEKYVYVSGTSPVFVEHFNKYSKSIVEKYKPKKDELVLDIGSNDGTLLKFFKKMGYTTLGVDPAKEISRKAQQDGIETINDFFTFELSEKIKNDYSKASLITANNVFAHCDDLKGMTKAISNLLSPEGIFVFEVSYLLDVLLYNLAIY